MIAGPRGAKPRSAQEPLWRAIAVYRFASLGYAALLVVINHAKYSRPDWAWAVIAVMTAWTVATTIAYARPEHLARGGLADVDISLEENPAYRWISPEEAGAVVVGAIKRGDLYALTHPEWYGMVERRHQSIATAFRQAADGPSRAASSTPAAPGI